MYSLKIKHGIKPRKYKDHRNYSFHRTFGAAAPALLDKEVNYDAGLTMPDQNAEGRPYGCTGYTTSELGMDFDGIRYQPGYTYSKTCMMEGHAENEGCDIQTALRSAVVYGLLGQIETGDDQALAHRRGQRFEVDLVPGYDWFDSMRSALIRNPKNSISIGTPWFPEWENAGPDGIVVSDPDYDGNPEDYSWHNWKISGIKKLETGYYLIGKSWQGAHYGDKGFHYLSRFAVNKTMQIRGTEAFTQAKARPEDIYTIKLSILQTIVSYCIVWIAALQRKAGGWYAH